MDDPLGPADAGAHVAEHHRLGIGAQGEQRSAAELAWAAGERGFKYIARSQSCQHPHPRRFSYGPATTRAGVPRGTTAVRRTEQCHRRRWLRRLHEGAIIKAPERFCGIERIMRVHASSSHAVASHLLARSPRPSQPYRELVAMQNKAGNRAVASAVNEIVVQRIPRFDDPDSIRTAAITQLLPVWLAQTDQEVRFAAGRLVHYRRAWIDGPGRPIIQAAIRRRLDEMAVKVDGRAQLQALLPLNRWGPIASLNAIWLALAIQYRMDRARLLSDADRTNVIRETGDRMSVAYTQFSTATRRQQAALQAEAADRAATAALFVDVFMGLLAPGIGRAVAALANRIPVSAPTVAYRAAIALLDSSRNKDIFRQLWKIPNQSVKSQLSALYGESDLDIFIGGLRSSMANELQEIRGHFNEMTDQELIVLCADFDSSVANEETYVQTLGRLVRQYRREVRPIGWEPGMAMTDYPEYEYATTTSAAWIIQSNGTRQLALISVESNVVDTRRPEFVRWISQEMVEHALAKMAQRRYPVRELRRTQVDGVP